MNTRSIQISTDTFAAIWRDRQPDENSEEEILRRRFNLPRAGIGPSTAAHAVGASATSVNATLQGGYHDGRFDVHFPEGFEIFRVYKNVSYRAKATAGRWLLQNSGELFDSLNALSNALGASENSWNNWLYRDERGVERTIDALRDKSKISRRGKSRAAGK